MPLSSVSRTSVLRLFSPPLTLTCVEILSGPWPWTPGVDTVAAQMPLVPATRHSGPRPSSSGWTQWVCSYSFISPLYTPVPRPNLECRFGPWDFISCPLSSLCAVPTTLAFLLLLQLVLWPSSRVLLTCQASSPTAGLRSILTSAPSLFMTCWRHHCVTVRCVSHSSVYSVFGTSTWASGVRSSLWSAAMSRVPKYCWHMTRTPYLFNVWITSMATEKNK